MKRISTWQLLLLPILAVAFMLGSCYQKDITSLDNPSITQKTCSDYPAGTAPADCPTTEEVMGLEKGRVNHPWALVVGIVLALYWAYLLYRYYSSRDSKLDATGARYRCVHCHETFTTVKPRGAVMRCPHCGAEQTL